jgi:hypothetical protein
LFCVSITKILEQAKEQIRLTKQQMQPFLEMSDNSVIDDLALSVIVAKLDRVDQIITKFDQYFSIMVNDAVNEVT